MLASGSIVVAPGAYDAWSARLVQLAGFEAVYMTGYGTAASRLAMPDLGLITASEMVDQARRLADAVQVPLIADADNGFGDVLNVQRTVRDYERAGVAAIQIEDQAFPKRCGHMKDKQLVEPGQMVRQIKAAIAARTNADLVVIARTDARSVNGLDEALRRGEAYLRAGADMLFVESPYTDAELAVICRRFAGVPLLANMSRGGWTPYHTPAELQAIGFSLVIYPINTLLAATGAALHALKELKEGTGVPAPEPLDFQTLNALLDLPRYFATAEGFAREE